MEVLKSRRSWPRLQRQSALDPGLETGLSDSDPEQSDHTTLPYKTALYQAFCS